MKKLFPNTARAKVSAPSFALSDALLRARRAHCGNDLRPTEPFQGCRFCGGDCDGACG